MTDFLDGYKHELKKKNLSIAGLSTYAAVLADVIGDWFRRYGEQQRGDREADRIARKALEEKINRLDARLFKIETHGISE